MANPIQVLKGSAVVLKQTGIPVIVVVGNKESAKKYIDEETSTPSEQYGYVDVNIIIREADELPEIADSFCEELPEDVMEAVTQASQDAINEIEDAKAEATEQRAIEEGKLDPETGEGYE